MAGRPTDYREEYNVQVEKLCKLGATDKEIADFFGIAQSTLYDWKSNIPEFSEAIKRGKIIADAEVAESLHKRAVGYQYREVTSEKMGAKEDTLEVGSEGMESIEQDVYKKKVVVKDMAPDVAAQNIWLKNRRGRVSKEAQRWADKVETGFTNGEGEDVPVTIFQIPDNGRNQFETKDNKTAAGVPDENPVQPG
jgi:hypothetical protein